MSEMKLGDHVFRLERTMIEETSLHRPDTTWYFIDREGHLHQWYEDDHVALGYHPSGKYVLKTVYRVHDDWVYDEDGERREIWHYACRRCGETIEPGYKADDHTQYVAGLVRCYIDNVL